MSTSHIELKRRHLLVLSGSAAAVACSGEAVSDRVGARTLVRPVEADASDEAAVVDDVAAAPDAPKEPFLDLDGGIASPTTSGWRPPGGGVDVGVINDFAVGTWRLNAGARAIGARDAAGFYAFSALCTHERCLVNEPDAMGVSECVCHGSRFDGNGRVLVGPAVSPLRHFAVALLGGRVMVDPSMRVADDVRTALPSPDAGALDAGADGSLDASDGEAGVRDTGPDVRDTGPEVDPCTRGLDVGPVTMFGTATWTLLRPQSIVVGHDAAGLYAFSALCTHQACTITLETEGASVCACHNSRFDAVGRVTRGPASEDLDHYLVTVCAGRVRVDRAVIVPLATRAVAP